MRVYLSGPMSGYPESNYPRFNWLAMRLRLKGHEVMNPAEFDGGVQGYSWYYYLSRDLSMLVWRRLTGRLDALVLHGRWWESTGAKLETMIAVCLRMRVLPVQELLDHEE